MRLEQQLLKYLFNRAVTAPWQLAGGNRQDYRAAIVIPALAEFWTLPRTLASLAANPAGLLAETLVVVVVNNRAEAPALLREENRATLAWLATSSHSELQLATIDASSAGLALPVGEGVGLARKIGFDAALARLDTRKQPLLISLDADTLVDANYLSAIFHHFDGHRTGGAVIPFRHQNGESPEQEAAIRDYELYLRSYRFGLELAASPYAWHTIGSAFACTAAAYVAAGGMNRRLAGEDFYFLQQLQKTTGVTPLAGTVVRPAARSSERVPFGTGQVIRATVAGDGGRYQWIAAGAFFLLKQWLAAVNANPDAPADELLQLAAGMSPQLAEFLDECRFGAIYQRLCANHPTCEGRRAAFHSWFDGLRTRRLLSRLTGAEAREPSATVADLLAAGGYAGVRGKSEQLRLLESLQGCG